MDKEIKVCFYVLVLTIVIFGFFSVSLAEETQTANQATYLGVEKCKSCHPVEYEDFSRRRFSKAWKVLRLQEETKNAECYKCHVTGAGQPGGFISEEETPHLTGKQCEACHGPGSEHVKDPGNVEIRKKLLVSQQSKNVCLECHICMTTHLGEGF